MISSDDSYSDTDDEMDLTKWTVIPTVNRDPFQFVGSREVQVKGAQTLIEFWNYIFPRDLVPKIVYETNRYAENVCKNSNPCQQYSRIN